MTSLHNAFVAQLRDMYSAESQILEALPGMIDAAADQELRDAFEHHFDQTREQLSRLREIFTGLGEPAAGEKCIGMEGLITEAGSTIDGHGPGPVRDALLIADAQRIEHYEIAVYGTLKEWADVLDYDGYEDLIDESLDEESEADEKLTSIAEGGLLERGVNEEALRV